MKLRQDKEGSEMRQGEGIRLGHFESGKRIKLRFEVLENLCSNVIIGADVLGEFS